MGSRIHMPAPVCLVEKKNGKFFACPEALHLLSEINEPVVVVAIVGLYRTGKSYLMNRLAGKRSGFPLGSTVQASTKGIWMWCIPYPERPNQTLVLLDTEGLGDVEKKCFIFDRPTHRRNMPHLEHLRESEMDPDFVEQVGQFCHYVYWTSKEKTIPGGHIVTGRWLAKLVENYVDSIRSGKVPCIENAVLALAEMENSAALSQASARYVELMENKLKLPTKTTQQLLEIHAKCENEAIKVFMGRAFKDDEQLYQSKLMKTINEKKEDYCHQNELESRKRCEAALTSLSQELEDKVREGIYSCPDGYKHFVADLKKVEEKYRQEPKKGIMADTVLQEFLKTKEDLSRAILLSDEILTEKEKEILEAKAKAEVAERKRELWDQQIAELQQQIEDLKRTLEVNRRQLEEKMKKDMEMLLDEQKKMLESKFAEREALLKEGFEEEARRLKEEIQHLKQENKTIKTVSCLSSVAMVLLNAASIGIPRLCNAMKEV